jgi:hypothetical protein
MMMVLIPCEEKWITLDRAIRDWANGPDGIKEAELLIDTCRAFRDGIFDNTNRPRILLIDKATGRPLSPKGRDLWAYLSAMRDKIYVTEETMRDVALSCNRPLPSYCSDATKGATQPSRLPNASVAMINDELRLAYDRAEVAGEKPPNVKEVTAVVQLALRQKGFRAKKSQIEKLAEAEEFRRRRWPPGKRRR